MNTEQEVIQAELNTGKNTPIDRKYSDQFSHNLIAKEQAGIKYNQDMNDAKSGLIASQGEIIGNVAKQQEQYGMAKYATEQTIEKMGWSGGYVTDANRQMEYLKSSIQAGMFNALELQKYGYTTSLEAARLAYEGNKFALAQEYMEKADAQSWTEYEQFGVYMSPEVKEMLSLRAQAIQREDTDTVNYINNWFTNNKISEKGITILDTISGKLARTDAIMTRYAGQWQSESIRRMSANEFQEITGVNSEGEPIFKFNEGISDAAFIDMTTLTPEDLVSYANRAPDAAKQVKAFIASKAHEAISKLKEAVANYAKEENRNKEAAKVLQEFFESDIMKTVKESDEALYESILNVVVSNSTANVEVSLRDLVNILNENEEQGGGTIDTPYNTGFTVKSKSNVRTRVEGDDFNAIGIDETGKEVKYDLEVRGWVGYDESILLGKNHSNGDIFLYEGADTRYNNKLFVKWNDEVVGIQETKDYFKLYKTIMEGKNKA